MKRRDAVRLIPFALPLLCTTARSKASAASPFWGWEALPGEPLALVYPRRIRELLSRVRERQSENILEAAHAIARTVARGNTCWSIWDQGHTFTSDMFPGRNGFPELVTPGYDPKKSRKGDLFLAGFPFPPNHLEDAASKGVIIVGSPTPWSGDPRGNELATPSAAKLKIRPYADIWIETDIDIIGAQVKIPGTQAPLGPESGPLMGTIFWMMLADACRVLARDGRSVPVRGDEPKLPDSAQRANLNVPLMDDYFDTVMRQIEMIGMELGDVRKMAGMAVDTLLAGGTVYFYSRYPESLASEAVGRRGGFAFARGLSDGKITGTSKDCVIMGTYSPDDEADIRNLDRFRSIGMRVASIGPLTRDAKIPEGRTVARETEVHIGRMTDTYGLFALPGFERKVCPTSGVTVTAILWTVSAEIAAQIIDRTGNTPAIYFNGALSWDAWWDEQVLAMCATRGY